SLRGERVLVVEREAILAPAGQVMQADPQILQHGFAPPQRERLIAHDQALALEVAPARADPERARNPADDLQIAHAAGRFLEVRLERIGRVVVLGVALLLLEALRLEKSRGIERL